MSLDDNKRAALASFRLIETGDADLADQIIAPGYVNLEADDDRSTIRQDGRAAGDLERKRELQS